MSQTNLLEWRMAPTSVPIVLGKNQVHVWCCNPCDAHKCKIDIYWNILAKEEKDRAERFYFQKDRDAYVFSRGILRSIISRYMSIHPNKIHLKYSQYGKPFIDPLQNSAHLHFNLSHTNQCVLYAFSRTYEIGVDVEYLKNNIDYLGIAKNFFSNYEYQALIKVHPQEQNALFYKTWTCKEAFVKAIGLGLSYSLADFDVEAYKAGSEKIININGSQDEAKQWSLSCFIPLEGYIAAIASKQSIPFLKHYWYDLKI